MRRSVKRIVTSNLPLIPEQTSATLLNFIFLMMTHPEVQEKLQAEIDTVVGRSRLPDLSDRKSLPYTNAVYKEVLRWHPIFPNGVPHRVMAEDEYNGMRIPAGSIVIPNVWFVTCSV
jgi:cytochrome P450